MSALQCPDCGQDYQKNAGHCRGGKYGGCCSSFDTVSGFDAHRTGDYSPSNPRRCLTRDEMIAAGWHHTERGYWRSPADQRSRERARARYADSSVGGRSQSHGTGEPLPECQPAVSARPSAVAA